MKSVGRYRIRGFRRRSPSDIERVNLMYYHPAVMKAKGYWKRNFDFAKHANLEELDHEMFALPTRVSRRRGDVLLGVVDHKDEIVGWIWFYQDKSHPLPVGVARRLGVNSYNSRIYQVSYEKLMSEAWPSELVAKARHIKVKELHRARKGVVVEGLALAIERLKRSYNRVYVNKTKLVLYAFTNPSNVASRIVLERNGFKRAKRKYAYDGVGNYLWVRVIQGVV